jgi:hypothetical protein
VDAVKGKGGFVGGIALEDRVLLGELPPEFRSPNRSAVDPEEGKGP